MSNSLSSTTFGPHPQPTTGVGVLAANPFTRPHPASLPQPWRTDSTPYKPTVVRRLAAYQSSRPSLSTQDSRSPPRRTATSSPPRGFTRILHNSSATTTARPLQADAAAMVVSLLSSPGTHPHRATASQKPANSALAVLDGAPASKSGSSTPTTHHGQRAVFPTQATYFLRECSTSAANPNATQQQIALGLFDSTSKDSQLLPSQVRAPTSSPY